MKLTVITAALAAMSALGAAAEVLTPDQALARLNQQSIPGAMRRTRAARPSAPIITVNDSAGQPALYVMDGSIIISADSEAMPLIGYVDSGLDSGNVPPAMQAMLEVYADEIGQLRAGRTAAVTASSRAAELAAIEPLCPTIWNQSLPYNSFCPEVNGVKAPTGCVATAIAQVLYTYRYPEKLAADISYTKDGNTYSLTASECGNFGWSDMKQTYGATDDATAVARLMQACGYAASMKYGQQVSSANMVTLMSGLIDYFDYDRTMRMESRDWYTLDRWQQIIWDELAQGYPVCYTGSAPAGGAHAFVVDGYRSNGYFHLNWGWGGQGNGYFLLSALNPSSQGIGGYAGGYNKGQQAIIGIRPGLKTAPADVEPLMEIVDGYNLADGKLGATVAFTGGFRNASLGLSVAATMAIEFTEVKSGTTYYAPSNVPAAQYGYFTGKASGITVTLPSAMAEGTYDVRPMTYVPSSGRYYAAHISPTQVLQCTVSGGKATFSKLTADIKAEDLTMLSPLVSGVNFKARFTAVNTSAIPFAGTLKLCLQDLSGNTVGEMTTPSVYIEGNSSAGVDIRDQCIFKGLTAGKYRLAVCDGSLKSIGDAIDVELLDYRNPGVLECTGVRFTSTSQTNVRVELDLKCTSGYYAYPVTYKLSGPEAPDAVTSDLLCLETGKSETIELAFAIPYGTIGATYSGAGTYYNSYMDVAIGGANASFTLTADPEPEVPEIPVVNAPKLECTSLECTSPLKGALEFKGTVRNSGADYEGPLYVTIYDDEGTPEDAPFLTHESVKLAGGTAQELTFRPAQMTWGSPGKTYSAEIAWKHPDSGEPTAMEGAKNGVTFVMTEQTGTEITEILTGDSSLKFYDLQGRRVASPRHGGIYLTSDGRKLRY